MVSDGFRAAVTAPSRMTRAQVRLEVLDSKAWLDNCKQASSQASLSRLAQVTNRIRQPVAALATFEPDYWRLDGSFVLPPQPGEMPEAEIGWWSDSLCDAQGVFDPPEGIDIVCGDLYDAAGITVTFDPASGEYAADFVLTAYDGSGEVIYSQSVYDNTSPVYRVERVIPRFRRVQLSITRWGRGQHRARVTEIDFGLIEDYGEDKLVELSLISELDPSSATLPAGELAFRLDNSDRRFNILNPQGLHHFLERRQRVTVDLGVDVNGHLEYIPAGTFYLKEWKSDQGTLTASFVARDLLDLLDNPKSPYRRGRLQTITVHELASDILQDAGVLDYSLDPALSNVSVTACVPIVSHRQALQLVAVASQAVVRLDRRGRLIMERQSSGEPVATIDLDNAYSAPAITLDPLVSAVDVEVSSYSAQDATEVYSGCVQVVATEEIWLEYANPCQEQQVVLVGGVLETAEHFAYASRLVISGNGIVGISVMAQEVTQVKTTHGLQDVTSSDESTQTVTVSNPLITDPSLAYQIAVWLLDESKRRLVYDVDWRQNPSLECGDLVAIEDEFGCNRNARLSRQELSYAGDLSGHSRAKGGAD